MRRLKRENFQVLWPKSITPLDDLPAGNLLSPNDRNSMFPLEHFNPALLICRCNGGKWGKTLSSWVNVGTAIHRGYGLSCNGRKTLPGTAPREWFTPARERQVNTLIGALVNQDRLKLLGESWGTIVLCCWHWLCLWILRNSFEYRKKVTFRSSLAQSAGKMRLY